MSISRALEALHKLHEALTNPPEGIQAAQQHFSRVIPDLRNGLLSELRYELSTAELETLHEELSNFLESPTLDDLEDDEEEGP